MNHAADDLSKINSEDVYHALAFAQSIVEYQDDHDHSLHSMGVYLGKTAAGYQRFASAKLAQNLIDNENTADIITKGIEILSEGNCGR